MIVNPLRLTIHRNVYVSAIFLLAYYVSEIVNCKPKLFKLIFLIFLALLGKSNTKFIASVFSLGNRKLNTKQVYLGLSNSVQNS